MSVLVKINRKFDQKPIFPSGNAASDCSWLHAWPQVRQDSVGAAQVCSWCRTCMDTCAREPGRPAPRVGLTHRDRPMVWHKNRFWGKKLIKNLFFPLVAEKPKHRTRHRFWSPESHPNCYWRQLGSFVDTPWRRHSRVHPCSARALWGIILRTANARKSCAFIPTKPHISKNNGGHPC